MDYRLEEVNVSFLQKLLGSADFRAAPPKKSVLPKSNCTPTTKYHHKFKEKWREHRGLRLLWFVISEGTMNENATHS